MLLRGDVFTADGSNRVSSWTDQTGNGNDAVQASGALQPLAVASGGTPTDRPTIRFDGSEWLRTGVNFVSSVDSRVTIFVVWRATSVVANQYAMDGISINTRALRVLNGRQAIYQGIVVESPVVIAANTYYLTRASYSGNADSAIGVNGAATVGDAGDFGAIGFTIGGGGGPDPPVKLTGDIAEVRAYLGAMNAQQIAGVSALVADYYGLTVTP